MKTKLVNQIIALTLAITAMVSIFTISAASSSAAVISPSFTLTGKVSSSAVTSSSAVSSQNASDIEINMQLLREQMKQSQREQMKQLDELAQNIRDLINSTSYTENPVFS